MSEDANTILVVEDEPLVAMAEKITSYGYIVKNSGNAVLLASVKMAFRLHEANRTITAHQDRYTTLSATTTQGVVRQAGDGSIIDGFTADITERKADEARLHESQELNRALFDETLSAIFIGDADGRFIDVNQFACEQTGYSRAELMQMGVFDLNEAGANLHLDGDVDIFDTWRYREPGDRRVVEGTYVRKDGTAYPVRSRPTSRSWLPAGSGCFLGAKRLSSASTLTNACVQPIDFRRLA
ncbi:MAG: PAS domain S-box protein [Spirochaeta sp.]|jgi:PAS domain S-box-containing protein|nr:PAS domain S-box protein [Spirochaeta sp.]